MAVHLPAPITPFSRTGGFYAKSWWRFLRPTARACPPCGRRPRWPAMRCSTRCSSPGSARSTATRPRSPLGSPRRSTPPPRLFQDRGWLDAPERTTARPWPPTDDVRVRHVRGVRQTLPGAHLRERLRAAPGEPGRDRWLAYEGNAIVRAWMLRHDEPRPWLVCVHGARMGTPNIDLACSTPGGSTRSSGSTCCSRCSRSTVGGDAAPPRAPPTRPATCSTTSTAPRRPCGTCAGRPQLDPLRGPQRWRRAHGCVAGRLRRARWSPASSPSWRAPSSACPVVDLVDLMEAHAGPDGADLARCSSRPA